MNVFIASERVGRRSRIGAVVAVIAMSVAAASCGTTPPRENVGTVSQAETPDSFGVGTGRDGAFAAATAGQIVNSYAPITAVNGAATQVTTGAVHGAPAGFAAGNLVLLWRTTGLAGVTSGAQAAITLSADVGAYEFGRIESIAGNVITLTNRLSSARYGTGSQIVRVPEYTTASIPTGTSLAPYAWDGTSGGIVALFATGGVSATGTGSIVADGAGFRGGGLENSNGPTGATALDGWAEANPNGGAHKGEGLVPSAYSIANPASPGTQAATTYGRGNYANGAGGGDAHNAGGGGGGNGGAGGVGGLTWIGDGTGRAVGGLPGVALTYATSGFLALGGGGGAGEENNDHGSAGGNGGGVVLVRAASLAVAGTLSANGLSAGNNSATPGDALGGGGAGGTIVIDVNAALTCVAASAIGGNGGTGAVDPDGPGGGGGGGVVAIQAASGACPATVAGGANGTTTTAQPVISTAWGAAPGNAGVSTTTFTAGFGGTVCTPDVIAANQCGGCVTSADCPASAPFCDLAKNTCGTCLANNLGACTGTSPTCDTAPSNDVCAACTGNHGATTARPCPTTTSPACVASGPSQGNCVQCTDATFCSGGTPACGANFACAACNGDNGTSATLACPTSAAPYCTGAGSCAKCASDNDCTQGTHSGTFCNTTTGACGNTCTTDAQCGGGNWCNALSGAGLCQPKVTNGNPVPGGACDSALAMRACVAQVCDADKSCGYANGDGACTMGNASVVCRSGICATSGANAGKCVSCVASSTCSGSAPVCDATSNTCAACNGDVGTNSTEPCPTAIAPFCTSTGACGKCTNNASCSGTTHAGPLCNASGACGTVCSADGDCPAGAWCNNLSGAGICQPRTPNGTAVPGGSCGTNDAVGSRACASRVCDPNGNNCGYANGDGPCATDTQCQMGSCVGALCTGLGDGGVEAGSVGDAAAAPDTSTDASSDGAADASARDAAREAAVDDGGPTVRPDAGPSPGSGGPADAANAPSANGTVEGGGLSCSARPGPAGAAGFNLIAFAVGISALRRRRRA